MRAPPLPPPPTLPMFDGPTRCGTVALVGRPNVGKSTLLNALLGQKIAATTHKPQTTRRALRGVITAGHAQLVVVDTPGLHAPRTKGLHTFMVEEALRAVAGVDVTCFVVEAKGEGVNAIHRDDEAALAQLEAAGGGGGKRLLIINKIDLVKHKARLLPFLEAWGQRGGFEAYIPICARTGDGLQVLLREIVRLLPEAPLLFPADTVTDATERDIAAELVREKVMLELKEELPYRAAVNVELFDESRRGGEDGGKSLVHIAAVIHVEKDSQKAMVIGKGGQRIKAIGQRARLELERLLDCQVMLELLVRVEPDWTTSSHGLAKLGYRH